MPAFSHALLGLALLGPSLLSGPVGAGDALTSEVLTKSEHPVAGTDHERLRGGTLTIYAVDGLDRFESTLSDDLPADPETAEVEALGRIQEIGDAHMAPAKNAAVGLAKAVQYGVDRYPAIVFDGRAIVYGVTDLVEALNRYEAWHREHAQ